MIYQFSVVVFYILKLLSYVQCQDSEITLYNPNAITTINTSNLGANLGQVIMSRDKKYLFLILDVEQIVVLDNQINQYQKLDSYACNPRDIVEKKNYLYTPGTQGLIIWRMDSNNKIEIINIYKCPYELNLVIIDENEESGIGISQGQLIVLNLSSKQFIRVEQVIGTITSVSMSYFLFQNKFLFITHVQKDSFLYNIESRKNAYQVLMTQRDIDWSFAIVVKEVKNHIFAFFATKFYGIYIYNFDLLYTITPQTKINFLDLLVGQISIPVVICSIQFSNDEKQIFLGARTQGILIYDISSSYKLLNPVFVQVLPSNGMGNNISLVEGENNTKYIYYADGNQFRIYENLQLNKDSSSIQHLVINTANYELQCTEHNGFSDMWTWQLKMSKSGKYIAISSGQDGMKLLDISKDYLNPQIIYTFKAPGHFSHDGTFFLEKRQILIVGHSQSGFSLLDIRDMNNIKYISTFAFPYDADCDGFDADKETETKLIIAAGNSGVVILDISDPLDIKILSLLYIPERLQRNGSEMVSANKSFTFGFGCIREQGVFYFSINPYTYEMVLLFFFATFGAEFLWFDIFTENYLYVADGTRGLTIIDVNDQLHPFILSNVSVGGWGEKFFQSRLDPNLIIISHSVIGSASIIDISDKKNPIIQSKFDFSSASSYSPIIDYNHRFVMMTKNYGFILCNLVNPINFVIQSVRKERGYTQLKQQFEQYESQSFQNNKFTFIDPEFNSVQFDPVKEVVYINQQITFTLILLVTNKKAKIGNTFLMSQGQKQQLPSWINFKYKSLEFSVNVPSIALSLNNNGINYILIEIYAEILDIDFVYPSLLINEDESKQIFNSLYESNLIDSSGYLSEFIGIDTFKQLYLNWYDGNKYKKENYNDEQVQVYIKRILSQSRYFEQIYFRVDMQNAFNINYLKERNYFIPLYCKTMKVQFSLVNSQEHNIVFAKYQELQSSTIMSDQSSQVLILYGNTDLINQQFLYSKIQIVDKSCLNNLSILDLTKIYLDIKVTDDFDLEYKQSFLLSDLPFIKKMNLPLIRTPIQSLIELQLPKDGIRSGDILKFMINPKQAFEFDSQHYEIGFKCYYVEDIESDSNNPGSRRNCEDLNWINIDYRSMIIDINTDHFGYKDKIKFIIKGSDGNYNIEDFFILEINLLPIYVPIIISIFSAILFFLLITAFFYRQKIHRVFQNHQFAYIPIKVNQLQNINLSLNFSNPKPYLLAIQLYHALVKLNSIEWMQFPKKYFIEDDEDEFQFEKLKNDIIIIKQKQPKQFHSLKISDYNNRSSPIIRYLTCLLAKKYYQMSDIHSFSIYLKVKHALQKEFPYVDWYKPILNEQKYDSNLRGEAKKKIVMFNIEPEETQIEDFLNQYIIDVDKLVKVIQYNMIKHTGKVSNNINEDTYNFELISECLRLDILGIDIDNIPNSKACTFGQFIFNDQYEIQTVLLEVNNNKENMIYKQNFNDRYKNIFRRQFEKIKQLIIGDDFRTVGCSRIWGVIEDKRSWISIDQVNKDQLQVNLNPKSINLKGEYRLVFYNQQGYVCYSQNIYLCKQKKTGIDSINYNPLQIKLNQDNYQNPPIQSPRQFKIMSPIIKLQSQNINPSSSSTRVFSFVKSINSISDSQNLVKHHTTKSKFVS